MRKIVWCELVFYRSKSVITFFSHSIFLSPSSDFLFYLSSINGEKEAKCEYYPSVKDSQVYLGNREVKK